uniref:Syntaxin-7 n=1 Tax=Phallusia mammillata TaxID=59560 RepID=A0A6F9DU60_9ASCI|nr:syntaxin-7 [Phallusia mammillata]
MYGHGDIVDAENADNIEMYDAPPVAPKTTQFNQADYTRLTSVVKTNIKKIAQNVQDLKRIVEQLGTENDTHIVRDRLHERNKTISELAKTTTTSLKKLKDMVEAKTPPDHQKKLQNDRLTSDFKDILNTFQQTQMEGADKEKQYVVKARAASTSYNERDEENHALMQETTQLQQTRISEQELKDIQDREKALRQLENDIMDVNQIFKDLASMVEEQGEVIDSIADNTDKADVKVENAVKQLEEAGKKQKSARKKKFIIIGVVILVLAIIGLVIGVSV